MREYRRCLANRSCIKCSVNFADEWFPAGAKYGTDEFVWLCDVCKTCSCGKEELEAMLKKDLESENQRNKHRDEIVELAFNEVKSNTFVYSLPLQDKFKKCIDINVDQTSAYVRSLNVCINIPLAMDFRFHKTGEIILL